MIELWGYAVLWLPRRLLGGRLVQPGEEVFGGAGTREGGTADFIAGIVSLPLLYLFYLGVAFAYTKLVQ